MLTPLKRSKLGHSLLVLLLASIAASGCSSSLPKLEKYDQQSRGTYLQSQEAAWQTGANQSAQATINVLEAYPDQEVRTKARQAAREIEVLEERRIQRREELLGSALDEPELLSEVSLVGVDGSTLPTEINPGDLRELLTLQALEAEAKGQLGAALRFASTAVMLEWTTPDRDAHAGFPADPREIGRRCARRLALVRIADPALAKRLEAEEGSTEPAEEELETPDFIDRRSRRAAIADVAALVERMNVEHVDQPKLADLHAAGIDEVLLVCTILDNNGVEISSKFMGLLATGRIGDVNGRTMPLLVSLDNAQHEFAGNTLPDGFALRAFAEGAAGALDQRTSIVWPDEFAGYMRTAGRRYRGIGATVAKRADGQVRIVPIPGGPARRAGMRTGDLLIEIEGIRADTLGLIELTNIATDPRRDSVFLLVEHEDGSTETVVVELGPVIRPHVTGWQQDGVNESGQPLWNWIADPVTRTAYLRLDGFRVGGEHAVRLALKKAQGQARSLKGRLEGLVLDLRANGGGMVPVAEEVANLFLKTGTIFRSTDGRKNIHDESARASHSELAGMPLVILVDERSASAAELVAGLLQVRADALVLGDQTYGKGSIQSSFRAFSEDCLVLVTIGWYLLPPESDHPEEEWRFVDRAKAPETWGVDPNVLVPMSVTETDAALAYRTRWFSGIGTDQQHDDEEVALDPAVQLALALIRARVLDTEHHTK